MKTAGVIPAFEEAGRVASVVRGAISALGAGAVIVVDDGSRDGTSVAARDAGAMVLRQDPNRGKGAALRRGYEAALAAGFERVVFLDADGQHDTGAIGAFLSAADGGADLVVGTRMGDVGRMPRIRLWTNRVTSRIVSWLAGARVTDSQCGFRLATAALLRGLDLECRRYDAESEMIIKAGRRGFRIAEVPVESRYGGERSSIRPLVDTGRFLRMVWRSRRWR